MTDKKQVPRKQNDALLKGAFEDNFADFLRFLFPDADKKLDLSKSIEFKDKELLPTLPDRERKGGWRVADLVAKVYLRNGDEEYFLINTEIEGGNDADFGKRMFRYNYMIWDRYEVPVTSIAFYTGGPKQPRPSEYRIASTDTLIFFKFRTYYIMDHSEAELLAMENIFAQIVLACQHALLEGKVPDEVLGRNRLMIAKALIRHGYDHIIGALVFLKNFLYVHDPEINRTFDAEIIQFSGGKINMGIIEVLKEQERWAGRQEGRQEERLSIALNLKKMGLPAETISKSVGLSVKQVEKL